VKQEVLKRDPFRAENDDGNFPSAQILLVLKAAIHRQQYVKSGGFCFCQKFTVLESPEAGEPRRLALVPRQVISQFLIEALVEQDPHSRFGGQKVLGFFECGDGHLTGDAGKSF